MKQSKFTISNRREKILNYLKTHERARVEELSDLCQVSPITIRRDLDRLVELRVVQRRFGMAELVHHMESMRSFEEKRLLHLEEKERIAQEVARYVPDGSTVFMNSGTTVLRVMQALHDKNITLVTNNAVAYEYAPEMAGELICVGGVYSDQTKSYLGDFTVSMIGKVYADVCILGINAINAVSGVTTSVLQETNIIEKMVERCTGKVIVVADGSKVGRTFSFVSIKLSKIDLLITDSSADIGEIRRLRKAGLEVLVLETQKDT